MSWLTAGFWWIVMVLYDWAFFFVLQIDWRVALSLLTPCLWWTVTVFYDWAVFFCAFNWLACWPCRHFWQVVLMSYGSAIWLASVLTRSKLIGLSCLVNFRDVFWLAVSRRHDVIGRAFHCPQMIGLSRSVLVHLRFLMSFHGVLWLASILSWFNLIGSLCFSLFTAGFWLAFTSRHDLIGRKLTWFHIICLSRLPLFFAQVSDWLLCYGRI